MWATPPFSRFSLLTDCLLFFAYRLLRIFCRSNGISLMSSFFRLFISIPVSFFYFFFTVFWIKLFDISVDISDQYRLMSPLFLFHFFWTQNIRFCICLPIFFLVTFCFRYMIFISIYGFTLWFCFAKLLIGCIFHLAWCLI